MIPQINAERVTCQSSNQIYRPMGNDFRICWYTQVSQVQTIFVYVNNAPKNYIALPLVVRYHLMTWQLKVGDLW